MRSTKKSVMRFRIPEIWFLKSDMRFLLYQKLLEEKEKRPQMLQISCSTSRPWRRSAARRAWQSLTPHIASRSQRSIAPSPDMPTFVQAPSGSSKCNKSCQKISSLISAEIVPDMRYWFQNQTDIWIEVTIFDRNCWTFPSNVSI